MLRACVVRACMDAGSQDAPAVPASERHLHQTVDGKLFGYGGVERGWRAGGPQPVCVTLRLTGPRLQADELRPHLHTLQQRHPMLRASVMPQGFYVHAPAEMEPLPLNMRENRAGPDAWRKVWTDEIALAPLQDGQLLARVWVLQPPRPPAINGGAGDDPPGGIDIDVMIAIDHSAADGASLMALAGEFLSLLGGGAPMPPQPASLPMPITIDAALQRHYTKNRVGVAQRAWNAMRVLQRLFWSQQCHLSTSVAKIPECSAIGTDVDIAVAERTNHRVSLSLAAIELEVAPLRATCKAGGATLGGCVNAIVSAAAVAIANEYSGESSGSSGGSSSGSSPTQLHLNARPTRISMTADARARLNKLAAPVSPSDPEDSAEVDHIPRNHVVCLASVLSPALVVTRTPDARSATAAELMSVAREHSEYVVAADKEPHEALVMADILRCVVPRVASHRPAERAEAPPPLSACTSNWGVFLPECKATPVTYGRYQLHSMFPMNKHDLLRMYRTPMVLAATTGEKLAITISLPMAESTPPDRRDQLTHRFAELMKDGAAKFCGV